VAVIPSGDRPIPKYSWKNVLYPHERFGHQALFARAAREAGYKWYCWNDRIYLTDGNVDTGHTVLDVS
jgi:hypothetical protein